MTIVVRNDISEIERLNRIVADFWVENRLPEEMEGEVNLALEEVLANVIMHGYRDPGEHEILVRLCHEPGLVTVAVEDDGVPFNPLDAPAPDITSPLAQRPLGGLGIHLVKNVMDGLEYRRNDNKNCLVMKKRVAEEG